MPDMAVFADTQAEPRKVYEWLDWLEKQLPFPVVRVSAGSIEQDTLRSKQLPRIANPPFFTGPMYERKPGFAITVPAFTVQAGSQGQLRRQCTREYKIEPMNKYLREWLGLSKGQRSKVQLVTRWIGISLDEGHRSKLSQESWAINRHPLIEKLITRSDCLEWMAKHGYPTPAKSACYFCPYTGDNRWRDIRKNHPEEWERAVEFDKAIRFETARGVEAPVYLHRSCKPLDEVDLRTAEDAGQQSLFDEQGFAVECEGMCGL